MLADEKTATDVDFERVEGVIGHGKFIDMCDENQEGGNKTACL